MSVTSLPRRPKLEETLRIPIAPDDKRRVYETAAKRNLTVAELVRRAIEATLALQHRWPIPQRRLSVTRKPYLFQAE